MTVGEMEQRMSHEELLIWHALARLENIEHEHEAKRR